MFCQTDLDVFCIVNAWGLLWATVSEGFILQGFSAYLQPLIFDIYIFIIIMHKTFLNSQLTWCVITQKWHTQTSELVTVSDWHSFSSCFCHKFTLVTVAQALEFDTDRHSEIIYDQWRQVVKPVCFLNCIVCLNKNEHIRIWLPSENYCKR